MYASLKYIMFFLLAATLSGCDLDFSDDSSTSTPVTTSTLQGTVFDAVTGQRITDKSLKVTLVQGTSYRNATVKTGSSVFAGDYALAKIPTSEGGSQDLTFRLDVRVDGYQRLQAALNFDSGASETTSLNFLGNIYLFPLGLATPDQTIKVTYNDEPVTGLTVLMQPTTSTNVLTADTSNIIQGPQDGFLGAITATTDTNGQAVFAGANLVLGGTYNVDVLPGTHEGVQLAQTTGAQITVGTSLTMQAIAMSDLTPGNDNGLYIVSASNSDTNDINTSGQLTLVFSREIILVHESITQASLIGATTAALDNNTIPDTTVTASLGSDNVTLTLTPNFSTAPEFFNGSNPTTADNGLVVQFSNLFVRIKDSNDEAELFNVFADLSDTGGNSPSALVQATTDF